MNKIYLIFLSLIMSYLLGCASNPVTGQQDFVLMTEDQEIDLGEKYSKEVLRQYRAYDDQ